MRRKVVLQISTMMALFGFALACAENPTEPTFDAAFDVPVASSQAISMNQAAQQTGYTLLKWRSPLGSDVHVSKRCTVARGCEIEMENFGVDVVVIIPGGALSQDEVISVTALAGEYVNFEFGPHGTQFNEAIRVKVATADTNAQKRQDLVALYWIYDANGNPVVQEELPATVGRKKIEFRPDHFSGYAIAM